MPNTDFDFLAGSWTSRQRRLVKVMSDCDDWYEFEATLDLTLFLGAFGTTVTPGTNGPDFDNNGLVNTADLVNFLGVFGVPCP